MHKSLPAGSDTIGRPTGARRDRAERAAAAPPTVEPDPGNAGEGKVIELPRNTRYDAVVIGAGLIGLACAWRASRRGLSVLVVDRAREPGAGASRRGRGDARARSPRPTSARRRCCSVNLAGARALARVRGRARGAQRPADRLSRERRARGGRRPRRRRGAAAPARVPRGRSASTSEWLPPSRCRRPRARPLAADRRRRSSPTATPRPTRVPSLARPGARERRGRAGLRGGGDRARPAAA